MRKGASTHRNPFLNSGHSRNSSPGRVTKCSTSNNQTSQSAILSALDGLDSTKLHPLYQPRSPVQTRSKNKSGHPAPVPDKSSSNTEQCELVKGQCVDVNRKALQPQDGRWSRWSSFNECSRRCGTGVQISTRDCDTPPPTKGGKYCIGMRMRYQKCNTHDCLNGTLDFREEQCQELNGNNFDIPGVEKSVQWVPKVRDKVKDGTSCGHPHESYDMCINGYCRKASCDNVFDSDAIVDKCGVCWGSNDTCRDMMHAKTAPIGRSVPVESDSAGAAAACSSPTTTTTCASASGRDPSAHRGKVIFVQVNGLALSVSIRFGQIGVVGSDDVGLGHGATLLLRKGETICGVVMMHATRKLRNSTACERVSQQKQPRLAAPFRLNLLLLAPPPRRPPLALPLPVATPQHTAENTPYHVNQVAPVPPLRIADLNYLEIIIKGLTTATIPVSAKCNKFYFEQAPTAQ
ncbi:adamts-20 [Culex quinquefasciatus]|uniref:Adamts-20 n=1 Tax=Culex quinquefasciatus TaxID=7176 RepID=B0WGX9_CULQU|nr:adamts-20 [Culex quinquefasciatus]|eukprot:XP_001847963.1 adamts-20 [Culex quinquefasciatus]